MKDDIVARLRDDRERRLFGDALMDRAADVIERLRKAFIADSLALDYTKAEALKALAEVERGDD